MSNILEQVPLQILTGFLGSGKTTLLNKIVQNQNMKGTVLIINEVGEIGIDDKLISTDNPVVLLDSGCICCTVQEGLVKVLHYLVEEKENNPDFKFNRVIIETTGVADPAPIIDLLFHYIDIECNYCFAGIITVVDGLNASKELSENYESVKQIAMADKIIISKSDLLSEEDLSVLNETLRNLNPTSLIFKSSIDNVPLDAFSSFEIFNTPKNIKSILDWINSQRKNYKLASSFSPLKKGNIVSKKLVTHSSYETISLSFNKPLNRISVICAFNLICNQYGDAILRLKGIFDFGEGYPFVIHGVRGECYPITNQAEWVDGIAFSEMVVICSPRIANTVREMLINNIKTIG
ncbi:MAG: CobW family GTP-binding protein [Succinivibrionaceae bacterium]